MDKTRRVFHHKRSISFDHDRLATSCVFVNDRLPSGISYQSEARIFHQMLAMALFADKHYQVLKARLGKKRVKMIAGHLTFTRITKSQSKWLLKYTLGNFQRPYFEDCELRFRTGRARDL